MRPQFTIRRFSHISTVMLWRIEELQMEHLFIGARMLRRELGREGIEVGRFHIDTLMRWMKSVWVDGR